MEKERNLMNDLLNNFCTHCNNPMEDEWQYCPNCKTKVELTPCVSCGGELKNNWSFCPYCKKEVSCNNMAVECFGEIVVTEDIEVIEEAKEPEDNNEWLRNMLVK